MLNVGLSKKKKLLNLFEQRLSSWQVCVVNLQIAMWMTAHLVSQQFKYSFQIHQNKNFRSLLYLYYVLVKDTQKRNRDIV